MSEDFNDVPSQIVSFPKNPQRVEKLKSILNSRATSFVQDIFPAARIQRGSARLGSLSGEPGESLWIGLNGDKIGHWRDHATDQQGGDLISLYMAAEHLDPRSDFVHALEELEEWCGLDEPRKDRRQSPQQTIRETFKDKPRPADDPLGPPTGTWHYLDENSNIIATVWRHDMENGSKTFRPWDAVAAKPSMPAIRPLYNLPSILHAEPIILVEGEKCADVLIKLKYAATTAMGGAHAPVDRTNWDPIKGKKVILWADNDLPGEQWLGRIRPVLETFGCKISVVPIPTDKPDGWDVADAALEGINIPELIGKAGENKSPSRFKFFTLADLDALDPPEWMVHEFLPEQGFSSIYGPSGSFKSFVAIDLALHLCHGVAWCGKTVQQKRVLYIAAEGKFGILQRVIAWHKSHNLPLTNKFLVLPVAVDLTDPDTDVGPLINDLKMIGGVDMTIVDTVARSFGSGDENSAKDMGSFIRNLDMIRESVSPHVMAIHHSGKDEAKGARGSSSFRAALDTEIAVNRVGTSRRIRLIMTKQKDAEEAEPIQMEAVSLEFVDRFGVIQKSAVMKSVGSVVRNKAYVGSNEEAILAVLKDHPDGLSYTDVVRKTNIKNNRVSESLKSLISTGIVSKDDSVYKAETSLSALGSENNE